MRGHIYQQLNKLYQLQKSDLKRSNEQCKVRRKITKLAQVRVLIARYIACKKMRIEMLEIKQIKSTLRKERKLKQQACKGSSPKKRGGMPRG